MSDKTGIEWTDATWNPTTGCDKVSPGCDHCYAMTLAKRLKAMHSPRYQVDGDPVTSGPGFGFQMHADALDQPLRWTRPRRIFVNSMSDLFHSDMTPEFLAQVFAVMLLAPQHTFQVLTKRPGRMRSLLTSREVAMGPSGPLTFEDMVRNVACNMANNRKMHAAIADSAPWPLPNVWLGTSVEDQKRADLRLRVLLGTPAAVRFLSCEPLLGPVDLARAIEPNFAVSGWKDLGRLDWVIVGGESGPGARPMHPDWARSLRDQCTAAGVAFHFKQWGEWVTEDQSPEDITLPATSWRHLGDDEPSVWKVGKHAAGRALDGRTWDEYPPVVTA